MSNLKIINNEIDTKKVIAKAGYEQVPDGFSDSIMNIIVAHPLPADYKLMPILSPKFFKISAFFIFVLIGLTILIPVLFTNNTGHPTDSEIGIMHDRLKDVIGNFVNQGQLLQFVDSVSYIAIIAIAAFLIIAVEYIISKKKKIGLR